MRIHFRSPLKSDILVFHESNTKYLKKVIPSGYSISVIDQLTETFFVNIKILKKLIYVFFKRFSIEGGLKNSFKQAYFESLILSHDPKAVITLIDNCGIFSEMSRTINTIPFIAIQNGLRHRFEDNLSTYHVQHFFSFGENEKKYFPKYKMEVENFYPAGSFLSSIFSKKNIGNKNEKFDVLIVSCWRGNIGYGKDVQDSMESMKIADNLLSKYLSKKKLKAAIILRSERDGEHWYMPEIGLTEEQYFKSIYTKNVKIIDADFKNYNIYKLIVNSDLLVSSFGTTTLLEGYGIGKKILYTIFCDDKIYHEIFDESILCLNPDQEYFENKLDEIISTDKEKYIKEHKKNMRFYMNQPKPDTLNFIKNKINEIISNQNDN